MYFDEYLLSWLSKQKNFLKPTTYYGYEGVIKKHIIPFFKPLKIPLFDLTSTHIQCYYNQKLEEGLSANTVKRHLPIFVRLCKKHLNIILFLTIWRIEQLFQQ